MGSAGPHSLTIHMAQGEIFTFRDVSLAVSKSRLWYYGTSGTWPPLQWNPYQGT